MPCLILKANKGSVNRGYSKFVETRHALPLPPPQKTTTRTEHIVPYAPSNIHKIICMMFRDKACLVSTLASFLLH